MTLYGLLAFAVLFLIVGVVRIVEFKAAGISLFQRRFLIPLHIIGCLAFSGAIALLALEETGQEHKTLMAILFTSGMVILFPLHIYVALKRRIQISK
jgi:hypothetical protein